MPEIEAPVSDLLPLQEPTFFILLSLAQESKHGYAILKDVEQHSEGRVKLSTGTLYEALARLLDQALIERVEADEGGTEEGAEGLGHPGRPRKTYRLTRRGRRVLEAETARMQTLVAATQRRLGEERK